MYNTLIVKILSTHTQRQSVMNSVGYCVLVTIATACHSHLNGSQHLIEVKFSNTLTELLLRLHPVKQLSSLHPERQMGGEEDRQRETDSTFTQSWVSESKVSTFSSQLQHDVVAVLRLIEVFSSYKTGLQERIQGNTETQQGEKRRR